MQNLWAMALGCFLITHLAILDKVLSCLFTVLQLFHNFVIITYPIYGWKSDNLTNVLLKVYKGMTGSCYFWKFSLREFHENLCNGTKYKNLKRFPSALVRQMSLGSLPANFESFSIEKSKEINSSELSPLHVFRSFMSVCGELLYFINIFAVLPWTLSKWDIIFVDWGFQCW